MTVQNTDRGFPRVCTGPRSYGPNRLNDAMLAHQDPTLRLNFSPSNRGQRDIRREPTRSRLPQPLTPGTQIGPECQRPDFPFGSAEADSGASAPGFPDGDETEAPSDLDEIGVDVAAVCRRNLAGFPASAPVRQRARVGNFCRVDLHEEREWQIRLCISR
jgi:hypothetical protein